jgi:tetratricopeptide (TPR) repeat protein
MKGSKFMRATTVTLLSLSMPIVSALQAQDKCDINDSSPFQLNGAKQYVTMAASSRKDDEVPKHLSNAIRVLTENPDKIKNEAGRQYLLLRTYAQWLQRADGKYVMPRGQMGFTTNPQGTHNLLLGVDSAATAIETMMPQCKATVRPYRQRFFSDILNKSVAAMNAEQNDSAVYFANLSLQVAGADPRPWNVLSAVYQKQNKMDSAMMAMEKVITLAGDDTLYTRVKQQSRYNLAVINLGKAEAAAGAEKEAEIKKARVLLEAYLKDSPGDANAGQALGRALRLSGDTAAVANMFSDMVKAPDKYSADQLFEAGSNAAATGRDKDAIALFEAGFKKNPNHRFALYNYANVLFTSKDSERMGPAVMRLMTVDPNFESGWRLVAGYWQLKQRAEADAAKKKMYGDSTLFYLDKQQKTNPRVNVTMATKVGTAYQLQGTVANEGQAAASWTMKLELLDETGAVVSTKDVALGPVDPSSSTTFAVKIDAPKAVAFRYAPIK